MKLLLQTAVWHAHASCACVHGGRRIGPDVNGRQKAFQRVHDGGVPAPSSSGSWWPLSAPLCLTRAILSISTISKAHRQLNLVRRSILDANRPTALLSLLVVKFSTRVHTRVGGVVRYCTIVKQKINYQYIWSDFSFDDCSAGSSASW